MVGAKATTTGSFQAKVSSTKLEKSIADMFKILSQYAFPQRKRLEKTEIVSFSDVFFLFSIFFM